MPSYTHYLRECLPLALSGSIRSALNWAAILIAALLGGLAQYLGVQLGFAENWLGVVLSAVIASFVMWVFIVLLRLFFVAPYQLWKLTYKPEYKTKLQEFYVTGMELLQRKLPADMSEEEFEGYVTETKRWASETARWIQGNISYPARVKFLDRTGVVPTQDPSQLNERHSKIVANLQRLKANLETLIDDWR